MDHPLWLLEEVHVSTLLQWSPVLLWEILPEKLELFGIGSIFGVVSPMNTDGLDAFVDHTIVGSLDDSAASRRLVIRFLK